MAGCAVIARTTLAAGALLVAAAVCAQSLPGPNNRPAPGNENLAATARDANYQPQVNYQLECSGCHLVDGEGARANDVPRMKGFVGHFLDVEGGREFLARVPGVSQSSFTDAQLAALLNWVLTGGMAGASAPHDFKPYSASEVGRLRAEPLKEIAGARNALLERMRDKDIAIEDGLAGRP